MCILRSLCFKLAKRLFLTLSFSLSFLPFYSFPLHDCNTKKRSVRFKQNRCSLGLKWDSKVSFFGVRPSLTRRLPSDVARRIVVLKSSVTELIMFFKWSNAGLFFFIFVFSIIDSKYVH